MFLSVIYYKKALIREIKTLLLSYFDDHEKVWEWLLSENHALGNKIPFDMILTMNEGDKLKQWIKKQLRENSRVR